MNIEEAHRIAQRHEDTYNNDFEHYGDLYADDCVIYRPAQGVTHDKPTMLALERRETGACPDRKPKVLRGLAGEGDWFGMEELWEGRTPVATRLSGHRPRGCRCTPSRWSRSAMGSSPG